MTNTLTDCPFCVRHCDHEIIGVNHYPGFGEVITVRARGQKPVPKSRHRSSFFQWTWADDA
jgi:hypothetical protein